MARTYMPVDRDQLFLLPPDMREWLPKEHLAWFVLEVVGRLNTSGLHAMHPNDGVGRRAYDPDMLLAVLVYAYCNGVRSSRQIERLCEVDVAFKVLAAGHLPDHSTIARFRQSGDEVVVQLFTDVLVLCAEAGLTRVGVVAVDGTKVAADASLKANRSRAKIEEEVRKMHAEAEATDAEEDRLFGERRGDELPEELTDPRLRKTRLDAALRVLDEQRKARESEAAKDRKDHEDRVGRAEEEVAREEQRAADQAKRRAETTGYKGAKPHPDGPRKLRRARTKLAKARARAGKAADNTVEEPTERANVTDPDSRIMKSRKGWVQGYNAQAAVTENGVVLAADVTQEVNDLHQCKPMMAATQANLKKAGINKRIGTMVFDAGYLSEDNLTAPGPDRLIATGRTSRSDPATEGPPPEGADAIRAMEHRLRTPEGSATYAKRQHTVEPVFGDIKHLRGFRRFSRRGLTAVKAEWTLVTISHNTLKLFRHRLATT